MDIRITKRFDFFLEIKLPLWGKAICGRKSVMEADFPAFNHIHTGRVEGSAGEGPKYTLPKKRGKIVFLRFCRILTS